MSESIFNLRCDDRFIPNRFNQRCFPNKLDKKSSTICSNYQQYINIHLSQSKNTKLLDWEFEQKCFGEDMSIKSKYSAKTHHSPQKILDAPNIKDDFYLNNLDWNKDNTLGISLSNQTFLYTTREVIELCKTPLSSYISSLKFCDMIISVATSLGFIQIYDLQKLTMIRSIHAHQNRISSLQFMGNNLISGSKDKSILIHDLKSAQSVVSELKGHSGQICSLKSKSGEKILASGGNDNSINIWDMRNQKSSLKLKAHKAAVKALDWCPWKAGYLASGGGNNDKQIKIWNVYSTQLVTSHQTQSPVTALIWNSKLQTLISSHGSTQNQVNLWRVNANSQWNNIETFKGHRGRILNMATSPDQNLVCTASSDQTIRFWKIYNQQTLKFNQIRSELH